MKINNRHARLIPAPPERLAQLLAEFPGSMWPSQVGPVPVLQERGLYRAGSMVWQEFERPGAARAFRVLEPEGLQQVEHRFELEPQAGGTVLRHTLSGEMIGDYEDFWRKRIEPDHDETLEALLDRAEEAVGSRIAGARK